MSWTTIMHMKPQDIQRSLEHYNDRHRLLEHEHDKMIKSNEEVKQK